MAIMIATPSSFIKSSPYHGITSGKLGGTSGIIHVQGMMKTKHASSWGLKFKAPTKVNATKVGVMDWSMLDPEKKGPHMVSDIGFERMIHDGYIFQEKTTIGIYEVGPDQTASVETLMNHLLETTANHMRKNDLMHDGFGSEEMSKQNLTWVVAKLHMVVERYPTWGDIVEIDTWNAANGKNGLCYNFTFWNCKTGEILVRATSFWVMMNKKTRKLSKFPDEVRSKLEQYYLDIPPIVEQDIGTWSKREQNIEEHICKGLKPRWSDLDFNNHVNHVKYIGFVLESVPTTILENYEIDSMTLQYYLECTRDSTLHSVTTILVHDNGEIENFNVVNCQHLLQFEIGGGSGNIIKGRTRWRLKHGKSPDSGALASSLKEMPKTKCSEN